MIDSGGGEEIGREGVHVEEVGIGGEEHIPQEHAKEEVEINSLVLLGIYQDDEEDEDDDQECEFHDRILDEMEDEDDGMERVLQDDTRTTDPDTTTLHAQIASLEERMSAFDVRSRCPTHGERHSLYGQR